MPGRDRPRQPRPWASAASLLARATAATLGPALAPGHRPMPVRHRHHPKLGHLRLEPEPVQALAPGPGQGPVLVQGLVPALAPRSVGAAAAVAQP